MQREKVCTIGFELTWKEGTARPMFFSFSRQIVAKSYWVQAKKWSSLPNSRCPQRGNLRPKRPACLFGLTVFVLQEPLVLEGHSFSALFCSGLLWRKMQSCSPKDASLRTPHQGSPRPPSWGPICDCCHLVRQGSSRIIMPWHQLNATLVIAVITGGIFVSQMKLS